MTLSKFLKGKRKEKMMYFELNLMTHWHFIRSGILLFALPPLSSPVHVLPLL